MSSLSFNYYLANIQIFVVLLIDSITLLLTLLIYIHYLISSA